MGYARFSAVLLLFCVSACRSLTPPQPDFPREWRLELPSELKGPIDASLPSFARIENVRVAAGGNGQVGITWSREMDSGTMTWDETAGKFRVDGSDLLLAPSTRAAPTPDMIAFARKTRSAADWPTLPPDTRRYVQNTLAGRSPPAKYEVLAENETSLMAIISPQGSVTRHFFSRSAFNCGSFGPAEDLTYANDCWHIVLYTRSPPEQTDGKSGITIAEADEAGWRRSTVVAESYGRAWIFGNDGGLDLFWNERYYPFLAFPDSGMERYRLNYVRIEADTMAARRTVYDCRKVNLLGFISVDEPIRVVHLGNKRYDLLLERSHFGVMWLLIPKDELIHAGNLLSAWPSTSGPLARYSSFHDCAAAALPDHRLQMVWDVEPDRAGDLFEVRDYRIMECHLDAWGWSGPREVARVPKVSRYGVAAAVVRIEERTVVLVMWQGEGKRFTYTVGSGSGQWSAPAATELTVGEQNWLVALDGKAVLVTQMNRNLYWCPIDIAPSVPD